MKIAKGIICINTSVLNDIARVCRSRGVPLVELIGCSIDMSLSTVHHYHNKPNRPTYESHNHRVHCLTNVSGAEIREGSLVTVDGSSGKIYVGSIYDASDSWKPELKMITTWADSYKKINVLCIANSTNVTEMKRIVENDLCDGFGHISTDMSFSLTDERLSLTETLISTKCLLERATVSAQLHDIFKREWKEIFCISKDQPVVMYLLQNNLGGLFPNPHLASELAVKLNKDVSEIKETFCDLFAINPSFALKGSRIGLTYPFIMDLQVRSVIEAAIEVRKEDSQNLVHVNICITSCASIEEVHQITHQINLVGQEILAENNMLDCPVYSVGIQVDTIKLALNVKDWIKYVTFIAFDVTTLTQLMIGVSLEDRHLFFGKYLLNDIIPNDPFKTIDNDVFKLISKSVLIARKANPNLTIGIDRCMHDERTISLMASLPIQYLNVNQKYAAGTKIAVAQARIHVGHVKEHHFVDDDNFFHNNFFPQFNLSG